MDFIGSYIYFETIAVCFKKIKLCNKNLAFKIILDLPSLFCEK